MRTSERGVALIMVILVLLVLTVLGMTAAMLMTQEDRISSGRTSRRRRCTWPRPACAGASWYSRR